MAFLGPFDVTTNSDEQKNAPELPIGRLLEPKSLGGNRVILVVLPSPIRGPQLANPYESSTSTGGDVDAVRHDRIATARRRVQIAILFYLCILPLNILFTSYGELIPYDGLPLVILVFLIFGFAAVSVYSLASRLRTMPKALLMTLAALIPLLGFVVLLYAATLKTEERTKA